MKAAKTARSSEFNCLAISKRHRLQVFLIGSLLLCFAGATASAQDLDHVIIYPQETAGGTNTLGTIWLTGAAPAGGATVSTSSNNPAATVPAAVLVAAGESFAQFTIATSPVTAQTEVTIT